jgi:hypothetical protein
LVRDSLIKRDSQGFEYIPVNPGHQENSCSQIKPVPVPDDTAAPAPGCIGLLINVDLESFLSQEYGRGKTSCSGSNNNGSFQIFQNFPQIYIKTCVSAEYVVLTIFAL